jgi:hypothetical protein
LSGRFVKWIWEVGLIELDVHHFSSFWVITLDFFIVSLGCLAFVALVCLSTLFHEAVELDLLQVVALGSLIWMH